MRLKHLTLKNWRNFRNADFDVGERLFVVGPNASGKSNLLDSLKFLRQIASDGGGFQAAVRSRGGLPKLRCLAARNHNRGHVTVGIALGDEDGVQWKYELTFTAEPRGRHRPILRSEYAFKGETELLNRPNEEDGSDNERMTQTFLEQVITNRELRPIVEFLKSIRYFHPVPHLIRGARAVRGHDSGGRIGGDPYGSDFLLRIAKTPDTTRERRLGRISAALRVAVPQLTSLELVRGPDDEWHLQAGYEHWRPSLASQNERDFSDGTLRLIGLLWSLIELEGSKKMNGLLLLEEPELSLHASVTRQLPGIFSRVCRPGGAQVLVTTHSNDILEDEGLGPNEVLVLKPGSEGTEAGMAMALEGVEQGIEAELPLSQILEGHTRPASVEDFAQEIV